MNNPIPRLISMFRRDVKEEYEKRHPAKIRDQNEKKLEISEPVTSFLKCFAENPRRFRLKTWIKGSYYTSSYKRALFTDLKTEEVWSVSIRWVGSDLPSIDIEDVQWMTSDEKGLVSSTLRDYYIDRGLKLHTIRLERKARKVKKERDRLTAIYKGDDK